MIQYTTRSVVVVIWIDTAWVSFPLTLPLRFSMDLRRNSQTTGHLNKYAIISNWNLKCLFTLIFIFCFSTRQAQGKWLLLAEVKQENHMGLTSILGLVRRGCLKRVASVHTNNLKETEILFGQEHAVHINIPTYTRIQIKTTYIEFFGNRSNHIERWSRKSFW